MSSAYISADPEVGEEETKEPLKGECSYSNRIPDGKAQLNCNYKSAKQNKNGNVNNRSEDDGPGEDTEGSILPRSDTDLGFRTPVSAGPIIELRGREVIFAILVFLFLSVSLGLIVVLAQNKVNETKKNKSMREKLLSNGRAPQMCQTEYCLRTALSMMEKMDRNAKPCEDFWQYACGGYVAKHEIPPSRKTWGVDSEVELNIESSVKKILESPISDSSDENSAEWKLKTMYNRCMDTDSIDELGARPLLKIIDHVGGWAVLEDWNIGKKAGLWNVQAFLEQLNFDYLTPAFFTAYVVPDDKASHRTVLQLEQGGLGLPLRFYKRNTSHPIIKSYKEYMSAAAIALGATSYNVKLFVKQTFEFEKELSKFHTPEDSQERIDLDAYYNLLTVEELQRLAPRIRWRRYVHYKYSEHFRRNSTLIIPNPSYLTNVSNLIMRTDTKILNYYMVWRLIDNFAAKLLSAPFRDAKETFVKHLEGTKAYKPRWRTCMDVVNDWFGMAVSSIFIKQRFSDDSKHDILNMVEFIRETFDTTLEETEWMDNITKLTAREKLAGMDVQIGYPDFLLHTHQVNDYYHTFMISPSDSYFQIDINGIKHETAKNILKMNNVPDKYEEWLMKPLEVNAFFSVTENKIGFPVGLLQGPYYNERAPEYINFGAIGSTIGHEITHGFDNIGSNFDKHGNLEMWWSPESFESFMEKQDCVSEYYSGLSLNGFKLNGMRTLGENIADIGGVMQSYHAYKKWEAKNGKENYLPGLEMTNNDKAFFLSFAQSWCIKRRDVNLESLLKSSDHAPGELRVNGTLSQLKVFADAFGCKPHTPMNPPDKCKVW